MCAEISGWISDDIKLKVCEDVGSCVRNADIVVTATFSPEPYLEKGMIQRKGVKFDRYPVVPNEMHLHFPAFRETEGRKIPFWR